MTTGRNPQIDRNIDWVQDEDNNVIGFMKNERTFVPLSSGQSSEQYVIGNDSVTIPVGTLFPDAPFTFEVTPDTAADPLISIRVDVSFDDAATYQTVGTFTEYTARRWVRSPEETQPTHLLVYRATGTSVASLFVVGA